MCGIVGYAHARECSAQIPFQDAQTLQRMMDTLAHRGPDAAGQSISGRVALGHRRLSVIDVAGGAQPMAGADGRCITVFNGEIYNYLELNAELQARGFPAHSRSDTETLLNAYACWGEACVEKFNGMFAFVIHDRANHRLFGARDRFGKKPFYYACRDGFFAFASEPKALLQHPSLNAQLDARAAARYFLFEFVPEPDCIFKGMRKLRAGERFSFDLNTGKLALSPYWDIRFAPVQASSGTEEISEVEWTERIRKELLAAVERRLISDVPLGVFLSGGIDSSAVTAAMVKLRGPDNVKTFSIGFSDTRFDESSHARRVAAFLGTKHHEERLEPDAAIKILPLVAGFLDEPFADASILPSYLLSRFARQTVTVALGGDGGDELFAGYDTFRALRSLRFYNAAVPGFVDRGVVRRLASLLRPSFGNFSLDFKVRQFLRGAHAAESERLWRWLGAFVPEELGALLTPAARTELDVGSLCDGIHALHAHASALDPIARDSYMFTKTYLTDGVMVKVDRATMACSLEARSPLLDRDFAELAAAIPSRWKVRGGKLKYIFKQAMREMLPADILARPKKGFGIPVAEWFRGPLRDLLRDTLHERRIRDGGLLEPKKVQTLLDDHLNGRHDNRKPLWTLFMFEQWRERWLKPATPRASVEHSVAQAGERVA
jgi:asparagine synthase (glutamine-hydrolysing)